MRICVSRSSTAPPGTSAPGGTTTRPTITAIGRPGAPRTTSSMPGPSRPSSAPIRSATSSRVAPSAAWNSMATQARYGRSERGGGMSTRPRILLTHTPNMRDNYYGARALAGLQELGDVVLHEGLEPLGTPALIAVAQGCRIIVADRATACEGAPYAALPDLVSAP